MLLENETTKGRDGYDAIVELRGMSTELKAVLPRVPTALSHCSNFELQSRFVCQTVPHFGIGRLEDFCLPPKILADPEIGIQK